MKVNIFFNQIVKCPYLIDAFYNNYQKIIKYMDLINNSSEVFEKRPNDFAK